MAEHSLTKLRYSEGGYACYLEQTFLKKTHTNIVTLNNMSANTFNDIIKYSESLTPDEQLRLATILIENVSQTRITIQHPVWQNLHRLVSALFPMKKDTQREALNQAANRWRAFFEHSALPTEDFMQERVDFAPQTRELF